MKPFYENVKNEFRVFYSDNIRFPAHLHSQLELLYVVSGTIKVTIFNMTKELKQGDFAVIFPNTVHSYITEEGMSSRIILSICSLDLTGDFFKKLTSYYPTKPFITRDKLHDNVGFAMQELERERGASQDMNACRALILLILSRSLPLVELVKNKEIENYDLTYLIVSYVAEHFQESLTLTDLANHLNVSKYYLSRIFSAKLNTSFNQYINYIRTNYASTLIQSTNYTLTRISVDSGFESQRTFNRAFKEIYQLSPSEYRQRTTTLN
jgi:AraC-like DNA-binding protein